MLGMIMLGGFSMWLVLLAFVLSVLGLLPALISPEKRRPLGGVDVAAVGFSFGVFGALWSLVGLGVAVVV